MAMRLLEANDAYAAETQFARSLEIVPDRVSTLNNLLVVKLRLEKFTEAEDLALKAIAADDKSSQAWSNLGIALSAMQRHEEALQAHNRALDCNPTFAKAWLNKSLTLLGLKRHGEALSACEQALQLDSSLYEAVFTKSRILKELGRVEEARKTYLVSLEIKTAASPVFIGERRATQKADILIISHNPRIDDSFLSFETLHRNGSNYPIQLASLLQEDFHFSFVFEGVALRHTVRGQIPPPDIVINNCANGELVLREDKLQALTNLLDSLGVPVVNHPAKVIQTTETHQPDWWLIFRASWFRGPCGFPRQAKHSKRWRVKLRINSVIR